MSLCGCAFLGRISAQEVVIVREVTPKIPKTEMVAPKQASAEFHIEKAIAVHAVKPPTPQPKTDSAPSATVEVRKEPSVVAPPAKAEVRIEKAIAVQAVKPPIPQPKTDSAPSAIVQVRKEQPVAAQPATADVRTKKATTQPRKAETVTVATLSSGSRQGIEPHTAAVRSVALQGATAFTRLANGFDFPVGKPEAQGYYKARGFRSHGHLGEDWDGVRGGDTDLGDPIYGIGDGVVVFARDCHMGWGNVIIVRHAYREGGTVKNIDSFYGHLQKMLVHRGDVVTRGQQIATMGNAHGLYDAHLHLEIRKNIEIGMSRAAFARDFNNYYDPTQFILSHRHLQTGGGTYRIAMNTFTHDSRIRWDKARNFSGYRGGGSSESASALKKAVASQNAGGR